MKNNKIILFILGVIILGALVFLFFRLGIVSENEISLIETIPTLEFQQELSSNETPPVFELTELSSLEDEKTENKEEVVEETEVESTPTEIVIDPSEIPEEISTTPEAEPEPIVTVPQEPQEFIIDIYSFTDWRSPNPTIYVDDTVTFVNHDNKLHWPGADPHPTHSSLPEFDALGGISQGQSYSYTFRKAGTYGHHDHLPDDPPTIGIITVLPRE